MDLHFNIQFFMSTSAFYKRKNSTMQPSAYRPEYTADTCIYCLQKNQISGQWLQLWPLLFTPHKPRVCPKIHHHANAQFRERLERSKAAAFSKGMLPSIADLSLRKSQSPAPLPHSKEAELMLLLVYSFHYQRETTGCNIYQAQQ